MPYCVVKRCKNTSEIHRKTAGLTFHKFPKEPEWRMKWTKKLRKNREDDSWTPSNFSLICSAHFEEKDLYGTETGRRRIRKDAVPTLGLKLSIPTVIDSPNSSCPNESIDNPTHSSSTVELPGTSTNQNSPSLAEVDSDTDSIFETLRENKLKTQLKKHQRLRAIAVKKIKSLQQQVRRFKNRTLSLMSILKKFENKNLVDLDLHRNLTGNVVSTELLHRTCLLSKGNKKLKFSPGLKNFCLTLDSYSPKAYEYVRKTFNACLPHRKTLAKWHAQRKGVPFTEESMTALKETVSLNTHSESRNGDSTEEEGEEMEEEIEEEMQEEIEEGMQEEIQEEIEEEVEYPSAIGHFLCIEG